MRHYNYESIVDELIKKNKELKMCKISISLVIDLLIHAFHAGGKLLVCGKGRYAADAGLIGRRLMISPYLADPLVNRPKDITEDDVSQADAPEESEVVDSTYVLHKGLPVVDLGAQTLLMHSICHQMGLDSVYAQQVDVYAQPEDVLLCLSLEGNDPAMVRAMETAKSRGVKAIGITGKKGGELKTIADALIRIPVVDETGMSRLLEPVYNRICDAVQMELLQP